MKYNKLLLHIFLILQISGFAGAATLNVGPGQTYGTIQSAVDTANEGDVVSVSEGTYLENVVVNSDGISIIAKNKDKTIVDGKKTGSVFRIKANNVILSGFTIQNSGGSGKEDAGVTIFTADNNTIVNNIIKNNIAGIAIYQSSSDNEVAGNEIVNNGKYGIFIFSSDFNKIQNNNIRDNEFGFYGDSARSNSIFSNNFMNNKNQAFDDSGMNSWDDGKSGNYWSDYSGNGVYVIPKMNSKDNFPLPSAVIIKNVAISGQSVKEEEKTSLVPPQEGTGKSTSGFSFATVLISLIMIYFIRRHYDN